MKHLFLVHSNITYLASLGVILRENLSINDVIIISTSKYEINYPIPTHPQLPRPFRQIFFHPIDCICVVKYIDKKISKMVDKEEFIAYIPALLHIHSTVITHPLCKEFHFIEEGLSVYKEQIDWHDVTYYTGFQPRYRYRGMGGVKQQIWDISLLLRGYKLEIFRLPLLYNSFFNSCGTKFYGFSEDSFYGVRNLRRISLKDVCNGFEWKCYYEKLEDVDIWLGQFSSANKSEKYEKIDQYVNAIEQGCAKRLLEQGGKKIMIKFHPIEELYAKQQTLKMFNRNGIEVEIIPDNVVLEIEFFNAKNIRLYSVNSSLLMYASFLGIECNSICRFLSYRSNIQIPALWKRINVL